MGISWVGSIGLFALTFPDARYFRQMETRAVETSLFYRATSDGNGNGCADRVKPLLRTLTRVVLW